MILWIHSFIYFNKNRESSFQFSFSLIILYNSFKILNLRIILIKTYFVNSKKWFIKINIRKLQKQKEVKEKIMKYKEEKQKSIRASKFLNKNSK